MLSFSTRSFIPHCRKCGGDLLYIGHIFIDSEITCNYWMCRDNDCDPTVIEELSGLEKGKIVQRYYPLHSYKRLKEQEE